MVALKRKTRRLKKRTRTKARTKARTGRRRRGGQPPTGGVKSDAGNAFSQGDLVSLAAQQYGFTKEALNQKVLAASDIVVKLMMDPKLQQAFAKVDVAAVEMGGNLMNKLAPIVLNTVEKTGSKLSSAGIQTGEGLFDATVGNIPGVDDVEGLMRLIGAGTKLAAAGMTTMTAAADVGTTVFGSVVQAAGLEKQFNAAIIAASNALQKVASNAPLQGGKRRRNRSRR